MPEKRVFTDDELKSMGQRNVDAITEAIDAGDLNRAKDLVQRMHRESLAMHDGLTLEITALLTFMGRRYGDEVLYEALLESCRNLLEPLKERLSQADTRRRVVTLAKMLRGHMMPIRIEEDDEKFTFVMEPCGGGGRLITEGNYQPPRDFLKIKDAQPMTFDRKDFPVYCAHHLFDEMVFRELVGYPLYVIDPAENLGEDPCRWYVYKNPEAAPKR